MAITQRAKRMAGQPQIAPGTPAQAGVAGHVASSAAVPASADRPQASPRPAAPQQAASQRASSQSVASTTAAASGAAKELARSRVSEMLLLNFEIDRNVGDKILPPGLRLAEFEGHSFVSVVAYRHGLFNFRGLRIPVGNFAAVGLRMYVARESRGQTRTGVYYVRQFVSRSSVSMVMGWLFGVRPPAMSIKTSSTGYDNPDSAVMPVGDYRWKCKDHENRIKVTGHSVFCKSTQKAKAEFICDQRAIFFEHRKLGLVEMASTHPKWLVWGAASGSFDVDVEPLFGRDFVRPLKRRPASVLMARGSEVVYYAPVPVGRRS